ncbi:MAG: ComF family protein, partial [Gammaproteobacteria bacterium]|nr:ComF family protein [Gammaproteobacteria bacterium]
MRTGSEVVCARCQKRPPPWTNCRALLPYTWPVDVTMQRLKYARQLVYAAAFGELLAATCAREFCTIDALCPVPLNRWRQLTRGFNQAVELCRPVASVTRLPVIRNVR